MLRKRLTPTTLFKTQSAVVELGQQSQCHLVLLQHQPASISGA
jgi:hypothetical protein